jgi:enoyl-CoA hydratase
MPALPVLYAVATVALSSPHFSVEMAEGVAILRLRSEDQTNRLTRECVRTLIEAVGELAGERAPLVITGNTKFFSAGADLAEIAALTASESYKFSKMGQALMNAIASFPAPVFAAVNGYCNGGRARPRIGLSSPDRIATCNLGASWGSPRSDYGLGRDATLATARRERTALELLVAAEKMHADRALRFRLVDAIAEDPVSEAVKRIQLLRSGSVL